MSDFASLNGRQILVSGGDSGIGLAFVKMAVAAGADVAVVLKSGTSALDEWVPAERRFEADLADAKRTEAAAQSAIASLPGQIDGLVTSAGIFMHKSALETEAADWDTVLAINLRGTFQLARAAAKEMRDGGSMVLVSSQVGRIGHPRAAAYAASKSGIEGFVRSLALELAPRNIRVNAVAPGPIETPMTAIARADEERLKTMRAAIPLDRIGEPDEVASAIRYMLSDAASYITGHALLVDGGITAA